MSLVYKLCFLVGVYEATSQAVYESAVAEPRSGAPTEPLWEIEGVESGKAAAEDMGTLMASPPMHIFRPNKLPSSRTAVEENPRPNFGSSAFPSTNSLQHNQVLEEPRYYCFRILGGIPEEGQQGRASSGRSVQPRTVPLLPPLLPINPMAVLSPLLLPLMTGPNLLPRTLRLPQLAPPVLPLNPPLLPNLIPNPLATVRSSRIPSSYLKKPIPQLRGPLTSLIPRNPLPQQQPYPLSSLRPLLALPDSLNRQLQLRPDPLSSLKPLLAPNSLIPDPLTALRASLTPNSLPRQSPFPLDQTSYLVQNNILKQPQYQQFPDPMTTLRSLLTVPNNSPIL